LAISELNWRESGVFGAGCFHGAAAPQNLF
jgi:hypothetical protein